MYHTSAFVTMTCVLYGLEFGANCRWRSCGQGGEESVEKWVNFGEFCGNFEFF